MSAEKRVSVMDAACSGKKRMVGSIPVGFAALGGSGLTVAAGDTFSKIVQIVVLGNKWGAQTDAVEQEIASVIRESEIFLDCDLPDNFISDRGRMFHDSVRGMRSAVYMMLEAATADLEAEARRDAQIVESIKRQQEGMGHQQGGGHMPPMVRRPS